MQNHFTKKEKGDIIEMKGKGSQGPHSNPKSNEFGDFAKDNYYYVRELMGI